MKNFSFITGISECINVSAVGRNFNMPAKSKMITFCCSFYCMQHFYFCHLRYCWQNVAIIRAYKLIQSKELFSLSLARTMPLGDGDKPTFIELYGIVIFVVSKYHSHVLIIIARYGKTSACLLLVNTSLEIALQVNCHVIALL